MAIHCTFAGDIDEAGVSGFKRCGVAARTRIDTTQPQPQPQSRVTLNAHGGGRSRAGGWPRMLFGALVVAAMALFAHKRWDPPIQGVTDTLTDVPAAALSPPTPAPERIAAPDTQPKKVGVMKPAAAPKPRPTPKAPAATELDPPEALPGADPPVSGEAGRTSPIDLGTMRRLKSSM